MIGVNVQIALDDLSAIYSRAECADIYVNERDGFKKELETAKAELEAAEKKISELQEERDDQNAEADSLLRRLAEANRELKKWRDAEEADKPKADALAYLENHDTPFETQDVVNACNVIRQLLASKPKAPAPVNTEDERPI